MFFYQYYGFPPMLHTHLHTTVTLTSKDKRQKPGRLLQSMYLSEIGKHWLETAFPFLGLQMLKIITRTNYVGNKIEHTTEHVADMEQNCIPHNFTYMEGSHLNQIYVNNG
jgi:hypothetical protein